MDKLLAREFQAAALNKLHGDLIKAANLAMSAGMPGEVAALVAEKVRQELQLIPEGHSAHIFVTDGEGTHVAGGESPYPDGRDAGVMTAEGTINLGTMKAETRKLDHTPPGEAAKFFHLVSKHLH